MKFLGFARQHKEPGGGGGRGTATAAASYAVRLFCFLSAARKQKKKRHNMIKCTRFGFISPARAYRRRLNTTWTGNAGAPDQLTLIVLVDFRNGF